LSLDLEPASLLYLDLFPASVSVVNFVTDAALLGEEFRVAATDNYLYVIEDTPDGPEMLIKEPLVSFSGTNKTGYTVETEFETYYIKRAPNCGCGASLRGIYLFPDAVYIRPTD
jgi:hypothetical protein